MIGILGLQGDVAEHRNHILPLYPAVKNIKKPEDLKGIKGLILPGGESTTLTKLIETSCLDKPLKDMIGKGLPVWGTCAGAILLCENGIFSAVHAKVQRNSYGSQLFSSIKKGNLRGCSDIIPMVFIRAPRILQAGSRVEILSMVDGDIVALKQGNIMITTFHPELTSDQSFASLFLDILKDAGQETWL